jgi:predicted HicB family RNase H-like nuclease
VPRKPPQKGERVKHLLIVIPEELHYQLRIKAAEQRATVKDFVINAIRHAVQKGGQAKE